MINIYIDADDTILNSSECVIDILNNKYGINPKKTIDDLRDWNYRSIWKGLTEEEVALIYDSEEFFDKVEINKEFSEVYDKYKNNFVFNIVSKGTWENLKKKKEYFEEKLPNIKFYGIANYLEGYDKSSVDMSEGIQIDDRTDCLEKTNAKCKILIKNNKEQVWNKVDTLIENLYIVQDWKEIEQYLEFTLKNNEWMDY